MTLHCSGIADLATNIVWRELDLGAYGNAEAMSIRLGESLLLTAGVGQTGTVQIAIMDGSNQVYRTCGGTAGQNIPVLFDQAGVFTVVATLDGTTLGSMVVNVAYVNFDGPIACQVGFKREKGVEVYGPLSQIFFTSKNPNLVVSVKEQTAYGVRLYLKPTSRTQPVVVQARLGGTNGLVLAEQKIDAFDLDYSPVTHIVVNGATGIANTYMTMTPWIPNIDVNCEMYASFSTFADGSTSYKLNTSDFGATDVNGNPAVDLVVDPDAGEMQAILRVDFSIPPDDNSYCFRAVVDQHSKYGTEIAEVKCNGKPCRFEYEKLYICKGDYGGHVLTLKPNAANYANHPNGHSHSISSDIWGGVVPSPLDGFEVTGNTTFNCLDAAPVPPAIVGANWTPTVSLTAFAIAGQTYGVYICWTYFADVVTAPKVDIEIFDGQAGNVVGEGVEETEGAFTVANINDTDGDGSSDDADASVPGEEDLMKVEIKKPNPDLGGNVTVSLSSDVRIWKSSDKSAGEETSASFAVSSLPVTRWVELTAKSTALHDKWIEVEYFGCKDKVAATGVWAEKTGFKNAAGDVMWADAGVPMTDTFCRPDVYGGLFGIQYAADPVGVQYAMGMEFTVTPSGVGGVARVMFDVTRQMEVRNWWIIRGFVSPNGVTYYWPGRGSFTSAGPTGADIDLSTDDAGADAADSALDEDNTPVNDHIYSIDGPGHINNAGPNGAQYVRRLNFLEYVRVSFNGTRPSLNTKEGSRCSPKVPWHARMWSQKNGTRFQPVPGKGNEVAEGYSPILPAPTP